MLVPQLLRGIRASASDEDGRWKELGHDFVPVEGG